MNTTTETNRQIAETIRQQIDRGVFMRLGAREFAFDGPALRFRIGSGRKKVVTITLTSDDLYEVRCVTMKGSLKAGTLRAETVFEEGTDAYGGLFFDMLDDSLLRLEAEVLA